MVPPHPRSRLPFVWGCLSVIAAFGWLVFAVAGNRSGFTPLPDRDGSTVESLSAPPGSRLELAGVLAKPESAWTAWDGKSGLRAARGDELWLRVTLRNPTARPLHAILADAEYFSDRVTAWVRDEPAGAGWRRLDSGEALRTAEKPVWGRTAAFPVEVPAHDARRVYLRAGDFYGVYLLPGWWPRAEDFHAAQMRGALVECLCYGALGALLLYNLILWGSLRFPDTGYYVLYAGGFAVFNFASNGGLAMLGFAAGSPGKEMIGVGALAVSGLAMVQFARVFLGTAACMPRADRALRRFLLAPLAGLLAGVTVMPWIDGVRWLEAAFVLLALTHASLLAVAVRAWRRGVRHARFFVAAFGLLFAGAIPVIATWLHGEILASAAQCMLAGSTLEMVLLAFAIADRFALLQRERSEAQRRLVEETEQRRVMQEAYADELELEVKERTHELEAANADKDRMIAVLGHDLRGPLTGLTQSAERLSAKRAPAELERFATDAGRTGRLLLLLIEDLVMWTRLRAGTPHATRHPVASWIAPALALHRSLPERDGVELEARVPPGLEAETDVVLMQALVRNLVGNAVKYARSRVEIAARAEPGGVRLTVRDDGPGLPADVAAWLAAESPAPIPFRSGLGLRFCVEISRALGARLESAAAPDGGAVLSVLFRMTVREGAAP